MIINNPEQHQMGKYRRRCMSEGVLVEDMHTQGSDSRAREGVALDRAKDAGCKMRAISENECKHRRKKKSDQRERSECRLSRAA
jgi:hypothetical protein